MKKFLYTQIANILAKSFREDLFSENRLIFFAEKKGGAEGGSGGESEGGSGEEGGGGTEGKTGEEEEPKEPEAEEYEEAPQPAMPKERAAAGPERAARLPEEVEEKELPPEVVRINAELADMYEKYQKFLNQLEYEIPPDIDPDRVRDARKIVDTNIISLNGLNKEMDGDIKEMMQDLNISGEENQRKVWLAIYSNVPEYSHEDLKMTSFKNAPQADYKKLVKSLFTVLRKAGVTKVSYNSASEYAKKFIPTLQKIAEHEWEMLKTINQVREVMWDMYYKMQGKEIEKRMRRGAEMYVGFPLEEGQKLEGLDLRMKSDGTVMELEGYRNEWEIQEVYINKKRIPDPEDIIIKQFPVLMAGVWVKIIEKKTGRIRRMPILRLKHFVNLLDLTPVVKNKKQLIEKVPYLTQMGIQLKPDMWLEYDDFVRDEVSGRPESVQQYVKITEITNDGVKLSEPVQYRAKFDSPDVVDHELKSEMTLGEFTKFLNQRRPVPVTGTVKVDAQGNKSATGNLEELQKKLYQHYENMNREYGRNEYCHEPINPWPGQVIFADAPGNPLYEIEAVDPKRGIIKIKNGPQFTFQQFLRWVYQYDMEPFKPDLEAEKARRYVKMGKRKLGKIKQDAENTIKHFKDTGIWRYTLDHFKKGQKGVFEPEEEVIRGKEENMAQKQSHSFLRSFIQNTHWLRVDDIFQLFKSGWEYYVRNWKRRQNTRYSAIGKGVPWFGVEFDRINQHAETEEVQQFKEAMDQWGVWAIEDTLYKTRNKDQAKACLQALSEKGQMRWDDPRLWRTINYIGDKYHQVPIPAEGADPYQPFAEGTGKRFMGRDVKGKTGMDFLPEAIDDIWGEGSYNNWKRQCDGTIEDNIQKTYNKAEELENDPKNIGGIHKELAILLEKHMNDQYVDPSEFEGLLRFIIEAGKGNGEDKVFHLLMGCTAENSRGRTIMGWERVGRFISKYCNPFPAMDFFTDKNPKRDPQTGEFLARPWIKSDFQKWTNEWIKRVKRTGDYEPPASATEFLWREVLTSESFQTRLEKGIRNAQAIDHDDTQFFIPALKESEIESICSNTGGDTKKFTIQGYKNAYTGFGMRLKSLYDKYKYETGFGKGKNFSGQYFQKMIAVFRSFMRYDAILSDKYRRADKSRLQRLDEHDFNSHCVIDWSNHVIEYQDEMIILTKKIIEAYKQKDNKKLYELPFIKLPKFSPDDKDMVSKQNEIEEALGNFGKRFEDMIMTDNGEKLFEVLEDKTKEKFLGESVFVEPISQEEKIRRKMELEMVGAGKPKPAAEEEGETSFPAMA